MGQVRNHPQHIELNDEVHARPPGAIEGAGQITCLAWIASSDSTASEWERLTVLLKCFDRLHAATGVTKHLSIDPGPVRIRWARHTEITRHTFINHGPLVRPLQLTVEGLSIAAISYYVVGLVRYLALGLSAACLGIDPTLIVAVSIPFVVAAVAMATHRVRKSITQNEQSQGTAVCCSCFGLS